LLSNWPMFVCDTAKLYFNLDEYTTDQSEEFVGQSSRHNRSIQ
jgi:hypothetical protein